MSSQRFVVIGLARVRAPWFAEVAQWATASQVPMDFLKCVSAGEVRARLGGARPVSAILADSGATGFDRDLIDEARQRGTAVIVVDDRRVDRDWIALGASALLVPGFDRETLLESLTSHSQPIRSVGASVTAISPPATDIESRWRGQLIAVTGGSGSGTSTVAMALAQGLSQKAGNEGAVLLADLAARADLAMYHDARDVVPGLQELVELHRSGQPAPATIRQQLFDIEQRGYSLLLGLRRSRDWTALRPRALDAAIDSLRASFRVTIADVDPEFDGEQETGSVDIEERNGPARTAVLGADLVVITGDATLRGLHSLVRVQHDLDELGVDTSNALRVVNRAPRSPRARAEIAATIAALGNRPHGLAPMFLAERRQVETAHRVGGPLPTQLCGPLAAAATAVMARRAPAASDTDRAGTHGAEERTR